MSASGKPTRSPSCVQSCQKQHVCKNIINWKNHHQTKLFDLGCGISNPGDIQKPSGQRSRMNPPDRSPARAGPGSWGCPWAPALMYPLFLTNLPLLSLPLVRLFRLSHPGRGARCGRGSRVLLPSSWHMVFWGRAGARQQPPLCNGGPPAAASREGSLLGPSSWDPDMDNCFVIFKG